MAIMGTQTLISANNLRIQTMIFYLSAIEKRYKKEPIGELKGQ